MDKTMEVVVVLMVLMIAAVVIIAFMTGQTSSFTGFANNTTTDARCGLWKAQYERRFCSGNVQNGGGSTLDQKIQEKCGYTVQCQNGEAVIN